jgi:transposase
MEQEKLEQLSKEELIHLIMELAEQYAQLKADNEAMKLKLEQLQKPKTTSKNSSQPPSQDKKSNKAKDKRKHRHGPPQGHEKHERQFVAEPDHVINLRPKNCEICHTDMRAEDGELVKVNQITELPEAKAEVIEVRQYEAACPQCGKKQIEKPPEGLEMDRRFGSRLETTVVYYRQEQHMSYKRTKIALHDLHGTEISQGGIDGIMQRVRIKAIEAAKPIEKTVRESGVINSDETGSRVEGDNWWEWVFCTATAILHVIRANRSKDVIKDVMGENEAEVWGSDCYSAQLHAPAKKQQLCMSHQIRNLQAAIDAQPTQTWSKAMQMLFRYAIHLKHQRSQLSVEQFTIQLERINRHCDRLLQRTLASPDAKRLRNRYHKHRQKLFVFLERTDVEPTNNVAERALRPSVIHRKVMGCFRSEWGAKAYAALASVIDTAELSGINAFDAIQSIFGPPTLPIPTSR